MKYYRGKQILPNIWRFILTQNFRVVTVQVVATCKMSDLVSKNSNFLYPSVSFKSFFVRRYAIEIIIIWPIMIILPLIESRLASMAFSNILSFVLDVIVVYPVMKKIILSYESFLLFEFDDNL